MKKIVALLMASVMILSGLCTVVQAEETDPFAGKDSVNIVYLGGSITQGAGVSDKSLCWVSRIGEYFKQKFPEKTINNYNMGLGGTGSDMGIMRLERDVLSKNPDYVFVEFAVNDIGKSAASRHMESIVRSLLELDNPPYITFVYTAKYDSSNQCLQNNADAHNVVADYYNIPVIDMKPALEAAILSTGTMEDTDNVKLWLTDLTHPTAEGYDCYTTCIKEALESGDYYKRAEKQTRKLDINSSPLSTKWTPATDAKQTGTWTENENPSYGCGLTSATPGDTLEFTFSGSVLGIQHRIGKLCGQYTLNIDGKDIGTIDTYYSKTTSQGVLGYQNFALGAGEHRVKITVLGSKNEAIADGDETSVAFDYFISEKSPSAYRWINEGFEDCDFSRLIASGNMTYDWSQEETANGSSGAMKVTVNGNSAGPSYRSETIAGTTYNVSAWIKIANIEDWTLGENSDKVRFIFQPKELNEDGSWGSSECYTECVVENTGIISGEWVKVSAKYVCDGKGKKVGVADRVNASDISRVEVRIGSGNLSTTTGSADVPVIYYLDDFKVEPENVEPTPAEDIGNVIKSGDFESAADLEEWTVDGKAEISYAEDGANGTSGSALVQGTASGANMVGISQKLVPIRINRAYKVSYWVKAANDEALGTFPQMIIEYKGKQTDPSIGATNYYPNYDMGKSRANEVIGLTNEWQKIEYVYKLDGVTNDICINPNMVIRLYDGSSYPDANQPAFYVDEVRIDELPIVYDGDFATDPSAKALNTIAKYKYPWGKYNNSQSGIVWNETDGADGVGGYLTVTQSKTDELMTYVDLEEGETYKISFYAKLDSWETESTSTLTDGLYLTAIFNRARSDLNSIETYDQQYQYIPTTISGETSIPRWVLTDEWKLYEAEFTVREQTSAKYRSAYVSFRLGAGNETGTYSIDGVKIEKLSSGTSPVPELSNISVDMDPILGMPVNISVDYSCSSACEAYIYNIYSGSEETGFVLRKTAETSEPEFVYVPDAADVGKELKVEIRAIAVNGNYSNIVSAVTNTVLESEATYDTAATVAIENESWSNRLAANVQLSADKNGADFMCVFAVYEEDGTLSAVTAENVSLTNSTKSLRMEISASNRALYAKAMVIDAATMKPYCMPAEIIDE